MLRATLKSLVARRVRLVLTAVSIVLGVGFVAGTFVLTDTMNRAFDDLFAQASAGSDVIVRSVSAFTPDQTGPGGGQTQERAPVPASLLASVGAVAGVQRAWGEVSGYAQMVDPATGKAIGRPGPPTLGVNWSGSGALEVRSGAPPTAPDDVMVDAHSASSYHLTVGERIRVLLTKGPRTFTISGTAGFGSADNLGGATLAIFTTPTAQQVLGRVGAFDQIGVKADGGVSPSELASRIGATLPHGIQAVTATSVADEQAKSLEQSLKFFRTFLLVFGFVALFVGAFIIFNTFTIIVAQRSRELALLRALGASRAQVVRSVILEALITGVIAGAVGVLAGVAIAALLRLLLKVFGVELPSTSLQIEPRTIVVAMIVAVVVTLVASLLPALRASRVSPVEAMREGQVPERHVSRRRRLLIGAGMTLAGIAILFLGLFGHASNGASLVGGGAVLTFVGVAILLPLVARPLAGAIGRPIRHRGVQGKLGRENAMRNPRRTASTAAALMVGLGLVAMVAVLSASFVASIDDTLASSLKADFVISNSSFVPFSHGVAQAAAGVDGVDVVSPLRFGSFRVEGANAVVTAVDPSTIDRVASLGLSSGATEALQDGKIVVLARTAEANGWKVGDTVPAAFATTGAMPLEMGGTFTQNALVNGDYLLSIPTFEKTVGDKLDSQLLLATAPGASLGTVQTALETAVKPFVTVEVQNQAAYRQQQADLVHHILGFVTALLAMAIIIALFGIVNTLGLSIFERRRELGLLRAVGLDRTQVKRMIRWESVIIAVMGALIGIAIGAFFGWSLQRALASQGITILRFPVVQLALYVVFAGLAGVLAAIWPARRAARLDVLEAIAYE